MEEVSQAWDYDIIIAGSGLCGASLAYRLNQLCPQYSIAVLDQQPIGEGSVKTTQSQGRSDPHLGKLISLTYKSYAFYHQLGLTEQLMPYLAPIRTVHVCEAGRFGACRISAEQWGLPVLGYTIPALKLKEVLHRCLLEQVKADRSSRSLHDRVRIVDVEVKGEGSPVRVSVASQDGKRYRCAAQLLIAADGSRSTVRNKLGIEAIERDCGTSLLVMAVKVGRCLGDQAYERLLPQGPLTVLPVAGSPDMAIFCWSLPQVQARAYDQLPESVLLSELQKHFGYRLGLLLGIRDRYCHPLYELKALESMRPGVVWVGNAAHTLHPVGAQGLNLGLRDVKALAEVLVSHSRAGGQLNECGYLKAYVESRAKDRRNTVRLSRALLGLTGVKMNRFSRLRGLGLACLEGFPKLTRCVLGKG